MPDFPFFSFIFTAILTFFTVINLFMPFMLLSGVEP